MLDNISNSKLYEFSSPYTLLNTPIFDSNQNKISEIYSDQIIWLGDQLVYIDELKSELKIDDIYGQHIYTQHSTTGDFGKIFTVDNKIISFSQGDYYHATHLRIFGKDLTLLFDSKDH